jgi:hypothetical protein
VRLLGAVTLHEFTQGEHESLHCALIWRMDVELDPIEELLHCWEAFRRKGISLTDESLEDGGDVVVADETIKHQGWGIGIVYRIILDIQQKGLLGNGIDTSEKEVDSNGSLLIMESTDFCLEQFFCV